jgi:hypothetical protein
VVQRAFGGFLSLHSVLRSGKGQIRSPYGLGQKRERSMLAVGPSGWRSKGGYLVTKVSIDKKRKIYNLI